MPPIFMGLGYILSERSQGSALKSAVRLVVLAFWCIVGALTMIMAKLFRLKVADTFPLRFHGLVSRLFSLNVKVTGTPATNRPTLYVCNHISYIDVFVLGGIVQGAFVAKSEVAGWPVLGILAKLQNTLFLERRARRAADQIKIVREHLDKRGNLIMFPEGTSTAGTYVGPFRSSLFAAADGIAIQPVTIAYTQYEGQPMTARERENYAWYLPDPRVAVPNRLFAQHFFSALGLGQATASLIFHDALEGDADKRKAVALECEKRVREGLASVLVSTPSTFEARELTTAA